MTPWHFSEIRLPDKPFLVIGKGPTFDKIYDLDLEDYFTFGLNHVCGCIPCDIGHCIDLDVLSNAFIDNCGVILIPWHPHVNCRPTTLTLAEHCKTNSYLKQALLLGKLATYDLSTWKYSVHRHGVLKNYYRPLVYVKYFSGEAAFQIAALLGVKEIYSVGIDGGKEYSSKFREFLPLTNKQKTFDIQFTEINKTVEKHNMKWVRL